MGTASSAGTVAPSAGAVSSLSGSASDLGMGPTDHLAPLELAVVEALTYADLFDWPLTPAEIHRYLPVPARPDEVGVALASPRLRGRASIVDGLAVLAGREQLAAERRRRSAISARLWPSAVRSARVVASLPFVRLVAISGSLAVGAAESGADVDLFVVTEAGRVWLTRGMTVGVVRLAALRGVRLCPNYLLAESALELPERDLFTAHELLQMVPVAGGATYRALLDRNAWSRAFLPNHGGQPVPADGRRGLPRRAVERALRLSLFDPAERLEMRRAGARLSRGATSGEQRFDESACKGHFGEHRRRSLEAFNGRVDRAGAAVA